MAAHSTPRRRRPWWLLGVLVGLVLIGVAAWSLTRPPAPMAPAYDVLTVSRSDQSSTVGLSGTLAPQQQANATFRVPGTVDAVQVKVGDQVAKGASLATVETRDLDDAVTLASAQLSAAKAQRTTVRDNEDATDAQRTAADAQVRSAEAALTNAQNRRSDATLVAPLAGTVAEVGLEVGDQVTGSAGGAGSLSGAAAGAAGAAGAGAAAGAGSGLSGLNLPAAASGTSPGITIIATDAWKLDATVGTADLPQLKVGQAVTVTPTGTDTHVAGVVDTVGIVADASSGGTPTFPVTVRITATDAPLFAGSSADAIVTTATKKGVLTVPVNAVTTAAGGATTVAVEKGGAASDVAVSLGTRFGANVEVLSGLAEGDHVRVPKGQVVQTATPRFGVPGRTSTPTPSR